MAVYANGDFDELVKCHLPGGRLRHNLTQRINIASRIRRTFERSRVLVRGEALHVAVWVRHRVKAQIEIEVLGIVGNESDAFQTPNIGMIEDATDHP